MADLLTARGTPPVVPVVQCWADGEDEYLVGAIGEGVEPTRECTAPLDPTCNLGLCVDHCRELHG